MKEYVLEVDPLALALTRPPLFMGIPMRLFFANVAVNMMICIDLHTLIGIPLVGVVHLILFRLATKDLQFFRCWLKYMTQTPPVLNSGFWGGTNSYSPG
ncbi:type IV secretion system protein VirB3 [Rickettsiella endosymbiont of Dermanyssus gallinae]|uniref:type IV secretion system protein VirB3 n=1 Tax=Rickettsiella endosymbiont of Dermanyssus gallinae TaxID=2856608 RepID=UPI001C5278A9|nr:VirB3 family type IV secretion system protein [Rickettsiella endosymbiont of Dermanyssus gallinae]